MIAIKPFQPSVTFHTETSHLLLLCIYFYYFYVITFMLLLFTHLHSASTTRISKSSHADKTNSNVSVASIIINFKVLCYLQFLKNTKFI